MRLSLGQRPFDLPAQRRGRAALALQQAQAIPQTDDFSFSRSVHRVVPGEGATVNETGTKFKPLAMVGIRWNAPSSRPLIGMSKTTKALKKQAVTSQLAAQRTADPAVAQQMQTLAAAFRAQAAVIKKNKKKK
jgi:hypothetical protein